MLFLEYTQKYQIFHFVFPINILSGFFFSKTVFLISSLVRLHLISNLWPLIFTCSMTSESPMCSSLHCVWIKRIQGLHPKILSITVIMLWSAKLTDLVIKLDHRSLILDCERVLQSQRDLYTSYFRPQELCFGCHAWIAMADWIHCSCCTLLVNAEYGGEDYNTGQSLRIYLCGSAFERLRVISLCSGPQTLGNHFILLCV